MKKIGSTYTFTAVESDSKLIVAWHLGKRTEEDALIFSKKMSAAVDGATKRFHMSVGAFKDYDRPHGK
jgi:hypothetical protein